MSLKKSDSQVLSVSMTLRDVLYISYAVPAGRMSIFVPEVLPLATVEGGVAFISIVVLQSTRVRLNLLPFARFNYYQLNIRTYVKDPVSGKNAVYFIKSGVTSRMISLVTRTSGIPWQYIDLNVRITRGKETKSYEASGNWRGNICLIANSLPGDSGPIPFFLDKQEAVDFLIRPLIGFTGGNRRPGRFTIRHPVVDPQKFDLIGLDFPQFTDLNVVDEILKPHSVFFLPEADFSIFLPPNKIKK